MKKLLCLSISPSPGGRAGPNILFNLPIIQNFILQFLPHYSRENHLIIILKKSPIILKKADKNADEM